MRYFFDTEFHDSTCQSSAQTRISLISVGLVASDGRTFYRENRAFDWCAVEDPWLKAHVKPRLIGGPTLATPDEIATDLSEFVEVSRGLEFWAYNADYDWVAMLSLFGRLLQRPKGWPSSAQDVKQLMQYQGAVKSHLPAPPSDAHNALSDAIWARDCHRRLAR